MIKYRKKPVVIEAMQFGPDPKDCHSAYLWAESYVGSYDFFSEATKRVVNEGVSINPATGNMVIATLEGEMTVSFGDWIIRGVQGEFYPCKPEIFEQTYERIEES